MKVKNQKQLRASKAALLFFLPGLAKLIDGMFKVNLDQQFISVQVKQWFQLHLEKNSEFVNYFTIRVEPIKDEYGVTIQLEIVPDEHDDTTISKMDIWYEPNGVEFKFKKIWI